MDDPESRGDPTAGNSPASAPSSISDVLYLIAAHHADIFQPTTLDKLSHANICFIRGDLKTALKEVNAVLGDLDNTQTAYDDILAFQLFMASMINQETGHWKTDSIDKDHIKLGATKVVALCIESNEHWHSGNLLKGLMLNHSAVQYSPDVASIWSMWAALLLAKKLSDIHIPDQASRVIAEMQDRVDSSGLHAFESVPEALRSVLYLQSGDFDQALRAAGTSLRTARQRATSVGVKLALSVSAMAQLGLGNRTEAAAILRTFHTQPTDYVLPDSVARAAFAETALVAAQQGPRAAADQIRAKWRRLGTESACFIEDVSRPAWLVAMARQAGDAALAERALRAIERLAGANRGISVLESAVEQARAAFAERKPELPPLPAFSIDHPRTRAPHRPPATSAEPPFPRRSQPSPPDDPDHAGQAKSVAEPATADSAPRRPPRLSSLSRREDEIARLVGRGMTNQQVASQLGLSPHTVNFHLRSIFRKLSISTRVNLGHIIAQTDRQLDPLTVPDQQH
jgi:DNA-binding CsgD family transcriptional regulator